MDASQTDQDQDQACRCPRCQIRALIENATGQEQTAQYCLHNKPLSVDQRVEVMERSREAMFSALLAAGEILSFEQDVSRHSGACQGCVYAMQAVIDFDIGDGDEEFDQGFGDLIDDMHDALAALHRVRRERYTSKHNEIANSWEAAQKLVKIAAALYAAIQRGRDLTGKDY